MRLLEWITAKFPLWVLSASLIALWHPPSFTWFSGLWISVGLGLIMLGMGITLELDDFRRVRRYPLLVICGVVLQYTVMPLVGWSVALAFGLPTPLAVGLILVACCPGGTASNVISYLARADVALSVTMTAISTLMAPIMTPVLTGLIASSWVDVPTWGLVRDTVLVIILPIVLGVLSRRYLPRATRRLLPAAPLMAVVFITLIVASIIGQNKKDILGAGVKLLLAVFTLHSAGFFFGYLASWLLTGKVIPARTIAIEVGMQNSGLGVVLAQRNFTASPAYATPSAMSSLFHSLIASLLAFVWRRTAHRYKEPAGPPNA